jgi:hypothetical protein
VSATYHLFRATHHAVGAAAGLAVIAGQHASQECKGRRAGDSGDVDVAARKGCGARGCGRGNETMGRREWVRDNGGHADAANDEQYNKDNRNDTHLGVDVIV